mgnify:CR=1 FL=1
MEGVQCGDASPVHPPQGEAFASIPLGRSEPTTYLYSLRRVGFLRSHVTVISTVLGDKLARVSVVLIPRLLASVQRTTISGLISPYVLNGVKRRGGVDPAKAEHDRVLVRAHDSRS